jgi:GntR family transcriptional repressor for pyruvate dehydrogenase complex
MPSNAAHTAFEPLQRGQRLADRVADAIRQTLLSGELKPGDALPSERELSKQFDVSRTVIREAIRSLSGKGLVQAVGGSGVRVLAVDVDTVGESMRNLVHGAAFDYAKVDEIRHVIEVAAAGFAAERATSEDIAVIERSLKAMNDQLGDLDVCVQADLAFHRALAVATHNELFLMLHDSLGAPLVDVRRRNLERGGVTRRKRIVAAHRRILNEVKRGDPEGARRMMRDHLGQVREAWSKTMAESPHA